MSKPKSMMDIIKDFPIPTKDLICEGKNPTVVRISDRISMGIEAYLKRKGYIHKSALIDARIEELEWLQRNRPAYGTKVSERIAQLKKGIEDGRG